MLLLNKAYFHHFFSEKFYIKSAIMMSPIAYPLLIVDDKCKIYEAISFVL